jgi:hypothetical protein
MQGYGGRACRGRTQCNFLCKVAELATLYKKIPHIPSLHARASPLTHAPPPACMHTRVPPPAKRHKVWWGMLLHPTWLESARRFCSSAAMSPLAFPHSLLGGEYNLYLAHSTMPPPPHTHTQLPAAHPSQKACLPPLPLPLHVCLTR